MAIAYSIAVMKAFGFTNPDITAQYVSLSVLILLVGILLGTVLANTLGEMLAGMLIASFGAATFKFAINPLWAYILCPLLLMCSVLMATIISTTNAGHLKISGYVKE